jgi:glutaconate CoA-transferase subunit A
MKIQSDKQVSLDEAAGLVEDGSLVAIGGGLSHREPMALVRQLIRRRTKGLRVVGSAHGIDVDLLVAAGSIAIVEESYVGYEQDLGLAPAYRRAIENGEVQLRETCCYTLLQQLRAAEFGIPYMPVRGVIGSGIAALHPEYRKSRCPFTGQPLMLVPALRPDVALIHARLADRRGNVQLDKPYVLDQRFAHASARVVVSAERVVDELGPDRITLPYYLIDAVTEAPRGAHPTSCYPDYTYDRAALRSWVSAASTAAGAREYMDEVVGPDEGAYQEYVADTAAHLSKWVDSPAAWMALMS